MSGVKLDFDDHLDPTPDWVKPYKRLAGSIMLQALDDIEKGRAAYRVIIGRAKARARPETMCAGIRLGLSADRWVRTSNGGPYSFAWICDLLGMDPDVIRPKVALGQEAVRALTEGHTHWAVRLRHPDALEEMLEGVA